MTTLTTPTFHGRLLQTVGEAVANDRFGETFRLGVGVVRAVREDLARIRRELENHLAEGFEARSFTRFYGPILAATDEHQVQLGRLLEELSRTDDTAAESFVAELRLLQKETEAFRDRLAKALALASRPHLGVDWDRLKEESDADFAAGRLTSFETPEDMLQGLGGGD